MSLGSWARFLEEVLRVEAGSPTIVSAVAGSKTTEAATHIGGEDFYGLGWLVTSRDWAGGRTLTHSGANGANSSVAWVAPLRGFAVVAVTNSYDGTPDSRTDRALDALAARLIDLVQTAR